MLVTSQECRSIKQVIILTRMNTPALQEDGFIPESIRNNISFNIAHLIYRQ